MRIFIKIKNHGIKIVVESEENSETVATSGGVVEKEDTSYVYESIADRRKTVNSSSEEGTKKSVRWLEHRKSDHKVSDEQQEAEDEPERGGYVNDDMEINYRSNINDKHRNRTRNHVKHHHSKSSSPTTSHHHRNMNLLLCFRVRSNPDNNTDNYTNTSNRALIGNKYHPSEHQNQTAIVEQSNSYQLSSSANSSSHKVKPENEENDANEKLIINVAEETAGEENSRSGDHSSTLLRSTFWRLITLLNRRSSPSSSTSSSPSPNNQEQQRNMMKNRHRHRHNHHNNNLNCCW